VRERTIPIIQSQIIAEQNYDQESQESPDTKSQNRDKDEFIGEKSQLEQLFRKKANQSSLSKKSENS